MLCFNNYKRNWYMILMLRFLVPVVRIKILEDSCKCCSQLEITDILTSYSLYM